MQKTLYTVALILAVLFIQCANAQTVFHRGYMDTSGVQPLANNGVLNEMQNGDFVYGFTSGLMRTDNTGEPLWTARYIYTAGSTSRRFLITQMLPLPNGDMMLFGKLPNASSLKDTFAMARVTGDGALVWSKMLPYEFPKTILHRKATLCANGDILLGFSQSGQAPNFTVATRMDISGNILWQHYYLNYSDSGIARQFYIWDVTECANGDFILGGFGSQPTDNIVTRIDANGTIVWSKKLNPYVGSAGGRPWRVRELPNGNIRVIIDAPLAGYGTGFITLTADGAISGTGKAYATFSFYNALIAPNGDMLFVVQNGGMMKVADNGNILFANDYNGAVPFLAFSGLCATADGGYAAGGSYYIFPASNGYLLKTSSSGDAAPYTAAITVADTVYNNTSTTITLLDSIVNLPFQDLLLTREVVNLADTLFALTVDVRGIASQPQPLLYPNPTADEIYVTTNAFYNATVYATDGRLMLKQANTNRIDVQKLPNGVYVLRLTDHNGASTIQRFVKQSE